MTEAIQRPFYCSALSLAAGEDVFGTASVGDFWVLVEYAAPWTPRALEGSTLPAEVKARLLRLAKTIPRSRVLFIRRGRAGTEHFNLFVVHSRERNPTIVRFQLCSYTDLLGVDFNAVAAGETAGGTRYSEPLYLVCTHGRRDKCCAKFGLPLYKSLRESAGESVWQSSHVGGDRFAGNLVVFPHGLFYGRVDEASARGIVAEYKQGRVALENFRGRACHTHPIQAAEFFVRREAGLVGVEALRHAATERVSRDVRRVKFIGAAGETLHEALVERRESEFRNYITCHATEQKTVAQYALTEYRTEIVGSRQ
jgi:hypothetical protein